MTAWAQKSLAGNLQGVVVLFWYCFFVLLFLYFLGFRAQGGKKTRQEATARKDKKEGRKEGRKEGSTEGGKEGRKYGGRAGRKEGRKEGTAFLFTSALETLAAAVLFAKP